MCYKFSTEFLYFNISMQIFSFLPQMYIGSKYRLSASVTTNNRHQPWKNISVYPEFEHVGKWTSLLEREARTNVLIRIIDVLPLMLDSAFITVLEKTRILWTSGF